MLRDGGARANDGDGDVPVSLGKGDKLASATCVALLRDKEGFLLQHENGHGK